MMMPPLIDVRPPTTCPMRAAAGGPGRRRDPRAWCCELVGAINAVKLHRDHGSYQRLARAVALAPAEGLSADWWEVVSRCEDWLKCNFGHREPAPLVVGPVLARACAHPPAPLPHWQSPREWQ